MAVNPVNSKKCSFCGRSPNQVRRMISGEFANICDECIETCNDLVAQEFVRLESERKKQLPTPREIYGFLDSYIIGQDSAKRALSVAVYNHYKRVSPYLSWIDKTKDKRENVEQKNEVDIFKSNILLIGPTGTGKTYLAKTLAKIMDVPFAIVDATSLTEAGYIGEDVENILANLLNNANNDIKRAEKGIVYIDEIDKIARKSESANLARDVSGEGVQQGLLKIIEGTVANIPVMQGKKHPGQEMVKIDTSNILFICSGSFAGMEKIISKRINKRGVGFASSVEKSNDDSDLFNQVSVEDLHEFGMIPEFIGRLPVLAVVQPLSQVQLVEILTKPKNSIVKQYQKLFEIDGVRLDFDDEALNFIAKEAIDRETGARGLRSIIEKILEPVMFEIPSQKNVKKVVVRLNGDGVIEPVILGVHDSKMAMNS
ncbi:MAG: ATP-dependent Clp protease ATP-binding subunit ClpX [Candidatus Ancillula sp.]|jgi:ATP-dependent Clp protease ATP-binding subunit ClpX|nr:ATP-dependent Clp protease ATP-binding subunit ClpX [Candidatus Ancillula sp.]